MPTYPPMETLHNDLGEQEYISQHRGISPVACDEFVGVSGWPTTTIGAHHAWHSWRLPMSSPGFQPTGSGGWLPQWDTPKHCDLRDFNRFPHNPEDRYGYDSVPRPIMNTNHYAHSHRDPENYPYVQPSPSRYIHLSSHGVSPERLTDLDVEPKVTRKKGKTGGDAVDLDKQRNRESSFRHPPIDYSRRQIRLVRILPTEPGAPIKCKFALSMVDNKSVRYTALSYTWGSASSESDIVKITLHKQDFWTRRNLWCFLRQARDDPSLHAKWYWIDALCIDQAENGQDGQQEKNHQVNMMSQIYSNAHLVMTWLGEPAPEDCAALDALQSRIEGRSSDPQHDLIRQGLRYLGDASYWSRIWIIQEVVLARKARLRVGDYDFSWNSVYRMRLEARHSKSWSLHDMGWAMTNILDLRQDWYKGRPLDLVNGMRDFGTQKCSDPRDKIYGLLGLMTQKPCVPDYSKSSKDLYVEVVLWALGRDLIVPPTHNVDPARAGEYRVTVSPCRHLKLWTTALRLSAAESQHAQEQLANELGDDWPLIHPWNC